MRNILTSFFFATFVCLLLCNCSTSKKSTTNLINPPNGVLIGDNLYIDRTELSNINYREYLHYMKTLYSDKSFYLSALPDTTVWAVLDNCLKDLVLDYLYGEKYDELPVVGISFTQAKKYTEWRQDRVMESILILRKLIKPQRKINNVFTVEKYFSDKSKISNGKDTTTYYIEYQIPTIDDWNRAVSYQDSLILLIDCQDQQRIWHSKNIDFCTSGLMPTISVGWGCVSKNHIMINNLLGNVAEWTDDGKNCTGGSFMHSLDDIKSTPLRRVSKAEAWLGFRNVARWKQWKSR